MKIFISWSGKQSQRVAEALADWLPYVFQTVTPWVSSEGVRAGSRWFLEVAKSLDEADFGILCVTRENMAAPWILFEAGALSKSIEYGRVVPYLIDVTSTELPAPLAQFQAVTANEEGTRRLVQAISANHPAEKRPAHVLDRVFDRWWPELQAGMQAPAEAVARETAQTRNSPRREAPATSGKTTEAAFLESCPPWARTFFQDLLRDASSRGLAVNWATKGFSIRAHRPSGQQVSVLYGYPPGSMGIVPPSLEIYLKYLTATDNPDSLRKSLLALGGFSQGRGQYTITLQLTESNLTQARAALPYLWTVYEQIREAPQRAT